MDRQKTVRKRKEQPVFVVGLETEVEGYHKRDTCTDTGLKGKSIPVVSIT